MKDIRWKVEIILASYPQTRNNDIELYVIFLQKFVCENYMEKMAIQDVFERVWVNLAWLTRIRAKFQNTDWKYLSDKQTKKFREEKEKKMVEEYSPINNWTRY